MLMIGKGPGMFGGSMMQGHENDPNGTPPTKHYRSGSWLLLLLAAGVLIAIILILIFVL